MPLFSQNKKVGVQSFILKMVNNNCPELEAMIEGPRLDRRVNLTVVVVIVPVERGKPVVDEAFTAVTKEFSTSGLAIVLDRPVGLDEVIVGFRCEADMVFIRGKAKHLNHQLYPTRSKTEVFCRRRLCRRLNHQPPTAQIADRVASYRFKTRNS